MSFRNLTSGQRKQLQRGFLSGSAAAMVSRRNAAASPSGFGGFIKSIVGNTGFKILGFTRILDNLAASYFGAGALIGPVQKVLGLQDPYVQSGLLKNPRDAALASLAGNTVAGVAGSVAGGIASPGGLTFGDVVTAAGQVGGGVLSGVALSTRDRMASTMPMASPGIVPTGSFVGATPSPWGGAVADGAVPFISVIPARAFGTSSTSLSGAPFSPLARAAFAGVEKGLNNVSAAIAKVGGPATWVLLLLAALFSVMLWRRYAR